MYLFPLEVSCISDLIAKGISRTALSKAQASKDDCEAVRSRFSIVTPRKLRRMVVAPNAGELVSEQIAEMDAEGHRVLSPTRFAVTD